MYKLLVLPLFFAAASAGLIGSPLGAQYALGGIPAAYASPYGSPYSLGVAHASPYSLGVAHASPYSLGVAHASPYSLGVAHAPLAYSSPIVKSIAAPAIYGSPYVRHVAPVHYSAPIVKTVIPAATSYSNTYKVSQSIAPVVHASPLLGHAVHGQVLGHAVASPYGYASPYAVASPLAYSHGLGVLH